MEFLHRSKQPLDPHLIITNTCLLNSMSFLLDFVRLPLMVVLGSLSRAWRRYLDPCGLDSTVSSLVTIAMLHQQALLKPERLETLVPSPMLQEHQLSVAPLLCLTCTDRILEQRLLNPFPPLSVAPHDTCPTSMRQTRHPNNSEDDHRLIRSDLLH
jgi:hypothetical protein